LIDAPRIAQRGRAGDFLRNSRFAPVEQIESGFDGVANFPLGLRADIGAIVEGSFDRPL
jgi:hypothetical protein